ncbi:hypothetical protein NQ314_017261 [Rhamnusium bicolor]|uniref:Uncharacterized protein n=1 Tax=Rhamnusium bicolor TaxID=1586634 RepID=A0AAV8WV92_9CUCU|nr:hypothetical protein NQ314_017261 [Rhamnusium bicolor]
MALKKSSNKPVLQKTRFGWIVSGPINKRQSNLVYTHFNQTLDIQEQLARFWEPEESVPEKSLSKEEIACKSHFVENVKRANDSRFIVALPLKESIEKLGESYDQPEFKKHCRFYERI